mmetsp:Transcript_12010/g.33988  ORF Transcript_12010/g.33988 Transcript_12010/m.33988 type:complete len:390 (-) Transcript_12010:85-1254(-)
MGLRRVVRPGALPAHPRERLPLLHRPRLDVEPVRRHGGGECRGGEGHLAADDRCDTCELHHHARAPGAARDPRGARHQADQVFPGDPHDDHVDPEVGHLLDVVADPARDRHVLVLRPAHEQRDGLPQEGGGGQRARGQAARAVRVDPARQLHALPGHRGGGQLGRGLGSPLRHGLGQRPRVHLLHLLHALRPHEHHHRRLRRHRDPERAGRPGRDDPGALPGPAVDAEPGEEVLRGGRRGGAHDVRAVRDAPAGQQGQGAPGRHRDRGGGGPRPLPPARRGRAWVRDDRGLPGRVHAAEGQRQVHRPRHADVREQAAARAVQAPPRRERGGHGQALPHRRRQRAAHGEAVPHRGARLRRSHAQAAARHCSYVTRSSIAGRSRRTVTKAS